MNAPCKDCPDRKVTLENGKVCEATCEKYQNFRKYLTDFNNKRRADKQAENAIFEIWSTKKRERWILK